MIERRGPPVVAGEEVTTQGHQIAIAENKTLLGRIVANFDECACSGGLTHGAMLLGLHRAPPGHWPTELRAARRLRRVWRESDVSASRKFTERCHVAVGEVGGFSRAE
jgi:hypothetical protein